MWMKTEAVYSSETSVSTYQTSRSHWIRSQYGSTVYCYAPKRQCLATEILEPICVLPIRLGLYAVRCTHYLPPKGCHGISEDGSSNLFRTMVILPHYRASQHMKLIHFSVTYQNARNCWKLKKKFPPKRRSSPNKLNAVIEGGRKIMSLETSLTIYQITRCQWR